MNGHRKKGGLVTIIMVAALTLLGSTLVATPASAGEAPGPGYAGPCQLGSPLPGWTRIQRTYHVTGGRYDGQVRTLTMDYKAPAKGGDMLEACFFPGFASGSVYHADLVDDPTASIWYFHEENTEYLQSACPNDGKIHRWNVVMNPLDWMTLDGYWFADFNYHGYCGTEVSPGGPVVKPPAVGKVPAKAACKKASKRKKAKQAACKKASKRKNPKKQKRR